MNERHTWKDPEHRKVLTACLQRGLRMATPVPQRSPGVQPMIVPSLAFAVGQLRQGPPGDSDLEVICSP